MTEVKAVYAGTFDPVTLGPLDLIGRAARLFSLTVAVAESTGKKTLFTTEERVALMREAVAGIPGVRVISFSGLLADLARREGFRALVRGIRGEGDFSYEFQMAGVNSMLLPQADTVFLQTASADQFVSSSYAKEVASLGGSLEGFVTPEVARAMREKLRRG